MSYLIIAKLAFLFLGVWWSIINIVRVYYKSSVSTYNILLQSIGIVGFVIIQFKLYQ